MKQNRLMGSERKRILFGIIFISLGITMSTTLEQGGAGTVFIGLGSIFFLSGMKMKRDLEEKNQG